jgi:hypothetical protein
VSEFALRFAADEMERAERELENARLAWKIAKAARPTEYALDEMEALCDAVDHWRRAEEALHAAKLEVQADWAARWRHGNSSTGADPEPGGASFVGSAPVGESPSPPVHSIPGRVRFPGLIPARDD